MRLFTFIPNLPLNEIMIQKVQELIKTFQEQLLRIGASSPGAVRFGTSGCSQEDVKSMEQHAAMLKKQLVLPSNEIMLPQVREF